MTDQPNPAPDAASTNTDELDALLAKEGAYIPKDEPNPAPGAGEGVRLDSADACKTLLMLSFELIASRKGDHWKMTEEEATEAGKAYGALLDKYYPDLELGPEAAAVTVTAMIFLPRIAVDKHLAAEQAKAAAARESESKAPDLDVPEGEGVADAGEA